MIGVFQNFVKQAACFFFMAGYKQCPYKPECTNRKSRSRQPEIVFVNPEKPDVPLNKNDAFQKVQKRRVQEKR